MAVNNFLKMLIYIFSFFSIGFIIGKNLGKKESSLEFEKIYLIKLKEELWNKGYCPVCNSKLQDLIESDKMLEKNQEV
ncbi:hypothetical protein [Thermovenabulum gondwanense]|uniref:Uncharacterized protein n=1 Tax=Thermovenabulum gondwanense TaxID=520767 RepID=A0A162M7R8_9FIRM|nr:hypothetical protein [Thermovenabulum gondwanense]KYO64476.1 hypothetical protein ATZ99_19040 [Thermovenabulum gondwanense]